MEQKKETHTHTVMPKKLAQALMEAGMQHFDAGGVPETQSFGQHTTRNLGISDSSVFGQAGSQIDSLQGMNLYNAQAPGIQQQNFMPEIAGAQAAQSNVYQNQNNLAQQLLAQSQGQGPNIAQTQLANATGQNVQQQGALMASQRGANANPALLARQAAMQGSQIQQSAAGQSAALQAQQQIGAQQALGGLYQQQGQNALQAEQIQQQGQAAQNSAINQGSLGAQTINANASGQNSQRVGNMQSSFTNALGGFMGLSDGGPVPQLVPYQSLAQYEPQKSNKGGKEEDDVSGLPNFACGGGVNFGNYLAGGNVPGKASVHGDSKENDKVPAMLSPGEIVLPRSVTEGGNVEKKAIEFLRHLKGSKKGGYGDVIQARKSKGG